MATRTDIVVTLDGRVVDSDHPVVRADDPMFARGDGVFETLLVRGGRACLLDAHLTRLARSAAIVGLPGPDLRRWRTAAVVGAERWTDASEGVLRLVYGRARGGPTGFVTVSGLPPRVLAARRDGVSAMTLQRGAARADESADELWSIAGAKSLSYAVNAAALRHAERLGVGDVVFTSADGFVLEGPRSSVLIADADGVLLTPPSTLPILPGTTVQAVFDVARAHGRPCRARLVHLDELLAAAGVWLLSSVTLAARVHTLDGVRLPAKPVAAEVAALVDEAVGGTG
jgi:4-amino-4-deoxychorismate lyase